MKYKVLFIFVLIFFPGVNAIDYVEEFSIEGNTCVVIDEFNYNNKGWEKVQIIGCCRVDSCFYIPINENKGTYHESFGNLLQIESARQNLFKNKLTSSPYEFEEFFDTCSYLELDPPDKQIAGGIVDATEKSLPYFVSSGKVKEFSQTANALRASKIISKFNPEAFILSSACKYGQGKEDKVKQILEKGRNSFVKIKSGNIYGDEIRTHSEFITQLDEETKQGEGTFENLKKISYFISSLLTGGNIVEFSINRMETFKQHQNIFNEDVLGIQNSADKYEEYYRFLNKRISGLEDSLKIIINTEEIGWFETFLNWLFNRETIEEKELKNLEKQIETAKELLFVGKFKSGHLQTNIATEEFRNILRKSPNSAKKVIECKNITRDFPTLTQEIDRYFINHTEKLFRDENGKRDGLIFRGAIPDKKGCKETTCLIELAFLNEKETINIDFEINITLTSYINKTIENKTIKLNNLKIKNPGKTIEYEMHLDKPFYGNITSVNNHSILKIENEIYKYREMPSLKIREEPINVTVKNNLNYTICEPVTT